MISWRKLTGSKETKENFICVFMIERRAQEEPLVGLKLSESIPEVFSNSRVVFNSMSKVSQAWLEVATIPVIFSSEEGIYRKCYLDGIQENPNQ